MMIYIIWYALTNMDTDLESFMIYTVYMFTFVVCFAVMCGAISVITSYNFIKRVYKKIDRQTK